MKKTEPLWLPRGSVRAILALMAWVVYLGLCITKGPPQELSALIGVITVVYFRTREKTKEPLVPIRKE